MKYTKQPLSVAAQIIAISPPISAAKEPIRTATEETNIFLSYGRYCGNGIPKGMAE